MTRPSAELYLRLAEMILQGYRTNGAKSLVDVYQLDQDFLRVEPASLHYLLTNRDGVVLVLEDAALVTQLINVVVSSSLEFTYQNNQYVHISPEEEKHLRGIYTSYLFNLKSVVRDSTSIDGLESNLSKVIRDHFQDLSSNLARFFDPESADQIQENVILKKAVCSEYSPEFQLEILGIKLEYLDEPVLDLGCGKTGQLVNYLKAHGIETLGVDRLVDSSDVLVEKDWLEIDLKPNAWGTIISHMAFSNHFQFHHLYKHGSPRLYAQKYMHILNALQPGGRFYYAPGLDFIEPFLPPRYFHIQKRSMKSLPSPQVNTFDSLHPLDWSSVRVTKRNI
jgi:hypothetical protein